jgi:hypothetical protein
MKTLVKGYFVSVWDDDVEVRTEAELDTKTGNITVKNKANIDGLNLLNYEFFEDEDGNEYKVCPTCHEYILKDYVDVRTKNVLEYQACPECDAK